MSNPRSLDDSVQLKQQPAGVHASSTPSSKSFGTPHGSATTGNGPAGRPRIVLPSFKQVEASQRPTAPVNVFRPGAMQGLSSTSQWPQPQQQQQQQQHGQQHQQQQQQHTQPTYGAPVAGTSSTAAATGAAAGLSSSTRGPAAHLGPAAAAAAAAGSGTRPGLSLQLPRYNQAAPAAAAAAAQTGGPSSSAAAAAAGNAAAGTRTAAAAAAAPPINAVLVSQRQQGNPVLKHLRAVRWTFADIVPDYQCGANTAVLFLSLRYHLLQPEYVVHRLKALQRAYRLAVLLLLVDAEEVTKPLLELHKISLGADAVLVCAWSNEECARYIETFKGYEARPASSIKERTDTDYLGRLTSTLTTIRGINRSDAFMLASRFGSLADVLRADQEDFSACPGLGPIKARRLLEAFNQPFRKTLGAVADTAAGNQNTGGDAGTHIPQQQQQQQQSQQFLAAAGAGTAQLQQQQVPALPAAGSLDLHQQQHLVPDLQVASAGHAEAAAAVTGKPLTDGPSVSSNRQLMPGGAAGAVDAALAPSSSAGIGMDSEAMDADDVETDDFDDDDDDDDDDDLEQALDSNGGDDQGGEQQQQQHQARSTSGGGLPPLGLGHQHASVSIVEEDFLDDDLAVIDGDDDEF